MKGKIIKVLLAMLMVLITCLPTVFCATSGTVRMKIDNSQPWTNITISESYEACENLNSTSSTLGTSALEAHLTTDYDWSIMAVFSVSQYGAATRNTTTNNKSGIYDIGTNYTQTSGLLNTSTSTSTRYVGGLYDDSGNPKKYVYKIDSVTGVDQNGKTCISFVASGGTKGWFGARAQAGDNYGYPVSIRDGLFGVIIGNCANGLFMTAGSRYSNTTFRPVIWN